MYNLTQLISHVVEPGGGGLLAQLRDAVLVVPPAQVAHSARAVEELAGPGGDQAKAGALVVGRGARGLWVEGVDQLVPDGEDLVEGAARGLGELGRQHRGVARKVWKY